MNIVSVDVAVETVSVWMFQCVEEDDWLIESIKRRDGNRTLQMHRWFFHAILTLATRGSLQWEGRACNALPEGSSVRQMVSIHNSP